MPSPFLLLWWWSFCSSQHFWGSEVLSAMCAGIVLCDIMSKTEDMGLTFGRMVK